MQNIASKYYYDHEEIFLSRYEEMFSWALQLTNNNQHLAADLVHDVFIKFALSRPEINQIQDLNGYLYTALRNTYRSQILRESRRQDILIDLIEFDAAQIGVRVDPRDKLKVHEELRLICHYLCERKKSSKLGSILLLRYFLGYFPREIAQITCLTRQIVANFLQLARAEVKTYLKNPKSLHNLSSPDLGTLTKQNSSNKVNPNDGIFSELYKIILSSCLGECLPTKQLENLYKVNDPINCKVLAHIVSCAKCLDKVNNFFSLPNSSDRFPIDYIGTDSSISNNIPTNSLKKKSQQIAKTALKRLHQQAQIIFEHEPNEIQIVVNGSYIGSQTVNSTVNQQTLKLNDDKTITFIEIFSEQQLRLAYLLVDEPPKGSFTQGEIVNLSSERKLVLNLRFSSAWPQLAVDYYFPDFQALQNQSIEGSNQLISTAPTEINLQEKNKLTNSKDSSYQKFINCLADLFKQPAFAALVSCIFLLAIFIVYWWVTKPTSRDLLNNAIAQENTFNQAIAQNPKQIIHQIITVEESLANGKLVTKQRVEEWHNGSKQLKVRRVYNRENQLVAGEWQKAGNRRVYRAKQKESLTAESRNLEPFNSSSDLWQHEISVSSFTKLINLEKDIVLTELPEAFLLTYQTSHNESNKLGQNIKLVQASLKITRKELRPIEETFNIIRDGEERFIRYQVTAYENRSLSSVSPAIFEIEFSEQTNSNWLDPDFSKDTPINTKTKKAISLNLKTASTKLEIEILETLAKIGADLGEEVTLNHTAKDQLVISAIVSSERKQQILNALTVFLANPAIITQVETIEEALARRAKEASFATSSIDTEVSFDDREIEAQRFLFYNILQNYFADKFESSSESGQLIDKAVNKFASQMLDRSQRALSHAYAMNKLSTRFDFDNSEKLDSETKKKLFALLLRHSQEIRNLSAQLYKDLSQIPAFHTATNQAQETLINDTDSFKQLISRLVTSQKQLDQQIRLSFAISNQQQKANLSANELTRFLIVNLALAEGLINQINTLPEQ